LSDLPHLPETVAAYPQIKATHSITRAK
jgi:hypothetical protein